MRKSPMSCITYKFHLTSGNKDQKDNDFFSYFHERNLEAGSLGLVWQFYHVINSPGSFYLSINHSNGFHRQRGFLVLASCWGSSQCFYIPRK